MLVKRGQIKNGKPWEGVNQTFGSGQKNHIANSNTKQPAVPSKANPINILHLQCKSEKWQRLLHGYNDVGYVWHDDDFTGDLTSSSCNSDTPMSPKSNPFTSMKEKGISSKCILLEVNTNLFARHEGVSHYSPSGRFVDLQP
ncbi:hypothetical protein CEXT_585601 [Caerostris extrusa]|uniref:Uncharacterized protein n=1 Tax=Caerostris extrusa TaxID=172846 RepID=A0AAV4WCY6_CAEEX|nr:hypothetical protein CEXT_3011 [Caerostris extrusa]GIY79816.1 hypothetical protein CEXT_585601 [Caerostris extrusa]